MAARKKVTTKMIADYVGISQSTVSMILSNKPNVSFSAKTRERVLKAAEELGYEKRKKSTKTSDKVMENTIMIICALLSNGYYSMVIHSIAERAKEYGYNIFVAPTMRDSSMEANYLDMVSSLNPCGVIYLYPPAMVEKANQISQIVPMVSIGDKSPDSRFDSVELDSKKPGYLIGEHLIAQGHSHVTYISSPINEKEIGRIYRLAGLKNAFRKHGYPEENVTLIKPSVQTYADYPTNASEYTNGYYLTLQELADNTESTAFVGNNDMTALGIMAALKDRGYKIPRDYSVCGFDNIPLSSMPQISLTTIEHAAELKGREAVDLIYRKNASRKKAQESKYNYIMRLEYEPELIIRNSSGKCKRKKKS